MRFILVSIQAAAGVVTYWEMHLLAMVNRQT